MKSLIINADDFGLSDGVCKSILELFENGAISSTSLMLAAPNATSIAKKWNVKELKNRAGVHLQLSGGKPICSYAEVPSLYNSNKTAFTSIKDGDKYNLHEVEKEWRRQISNAFELLESSPTHLDSHHGVHRIPELFDIYIKLASEYKIPIRGFGEGAIRNRIEKECIPASIALVREWTGKSLDFNSLIDYIQSCFRKYPNETIVELVCHPGYCDEYLKNISSLSIARENDHNELLKLKKSNWFEENGYKLISFKDVGDGFNRCI